MSQLKNKMYKKLSVESLISLVKSIDTDKNPCIIQCNICKNDTHNKQLLRIGNTFSLTLNKHVSFSKQQKDKKSKE